MSDPDSVGIRLSRGELEAEVVVFRGGWGRSCFGRAVANAADPVVENPELKTLDAFAAVMDELPARLEAFPEHP